MKYLSAFFALLLTFSFLLCSPLAASAITTGFSVKEEKWKDWIVNENAISLITVEPPRRDVFSFDVNKNGLVAIAHPTREKGKNTVAVYREDGTFAYGYEFYKFDFLRAIGDICVEWDGENLNIILTTPEMIISMMPSGEVADVVGYDNSYDNRSSNRKYERFLTKKYKQRANGSLYVGEKNMFMDLRYKYLTVVTADGEEHIFYESETNHTFSLIILIVTIGGFLAMLISFITLTIQSPKYDKNSWGLIGAQKR